MRVFIKVFLINVIRIDDYTSRTATENIKIKNKSPNAQHSHTSFGYAYVISRGDLCNLKRK